MFEMIFAQRRGQTQAQNGFTLELI